ncbi:MAG: TVP38/TMEM64 family protein [Fuerstiella sp.]
MTTAQHTGRKSKPYLKLFVLATVATAVVYGYTQYGDTLTLDTLAQRETELREYQQLHPILIYGLAFGVYVAVTGLSLPGAATVLSLVYAWYFGLVRGIVLVSFASTMGATLAFLLSRYLLRETIQNRFGEKLKAFNRNLEEEGAFYLFTLRLIPAVPFFVINVVMGLTPMKTRTFWWVSQVGMFPGTIVFVYAGSSVPDLATLAENGASGILSPQLLAAFVVLGLFPLVVKKLLARFKPGHVNANK